MVSYFILALTGLVALIVGVVAATMASRMAARSRGNAIIEDAKVEAEKIKSASLLEAKENGLQIKADAERQANQRLSRVQSAEAKQKQREMQLNQMQSEVQRKKNENDNIRANLENQHAALEGRKAEIEKMHRSAQETLEHISGLSAEQAKEKLVESLKDEAKTAAASYINDIMDDAKLTANK